MPSAFDDVDVSLEPDLWVCHVRLGKSEASSGAQACERVLKGQLDVYVMKDADANDRVDLEPLETFAGFDVPHNDLSAVPKALTADFGGCLAELDCDHVAARVGETPSELPGPCAELETDDAGAQLSPLCKKRRAAVGAQLAGRTVPPPRPFVAGCDQLALEPLGGVPFLATFGRQARGSRLLRHVTSRVEDCWAHLPSTESAARGLADATHRRLMCRLGETLDWPP
jgi:hypothetical protein